jgi:hypothetical protein
MPLEANTPRSKGKRLARTYSRYLQRCLGPAGGPLEAVDVINEKKESSQNQALNSISFAEIPFSRTKIIVWNRHGIAVIGEHRD